MNDRFMVTEYIPAIMMHILYIVFGWQFIFCHRILVSLTYLYMFFVCFKFCSRISRIKVDRAVA